MKPSSDQSFPPATKVNPTEVTQWIRGSMMGDEASSKNLMEFLYPLVVSIVRARVPRRVLVEDLVQDLI